MKASVNSDKHSLDGPPEFRVNHFITTTTSSLHVCRLYLVFGTIQLTGLSSFYFYLGLFKYEFTLFADFTRPLSIRSYFNRPFYKIKHLLSSQRPQLVIQEFLCQFCNFSNSATYISSL